ncbi:MULTISPECIES: DUF6807 family protein [unclassified Caulobacter]|uniref:DUF6807 family protein n=1 Tax=unclassified Caulobacter TaxID=2648921 RepID=UPI0006FD5CF7|nr:MULTISPECIES: DUF6807 family protein [unclassified Caulobacter]KQV58158.1 hypothetical protein ASC62_04955 [Caulobacter sp. Root342]KQV69337.1 hypothetical protein ASC70_11080 [Caulobacter sp. Root343]
MSLRALLAAVLLAAATPALADPAIGKRVDAVFADDAVTLTEAGKTVLAYRTKPLNPAAEPGRANYVGALYAPDGAALVEDRPGDHPHQRGVWWAWMKVQTGGKTVADGWYMKGLTYFVREKRFLGDAEGGGTLTVDVDWMVNSGPELAYVARETTKVTVRPLKAGARRVEFDTTIVSRVDALGLGGSEDDRGFGGFSIRLVDPEHLTFSSGGKTITPNGGAIDAGPNMGFAWSGGSGGSGSPAWAVGLACKANGQAVKRWMLYNDRSMQNCVFPGRAPLVLKKDQALHLQETLVIRPIAKKKP